MLFMWFGKHLINVIWPKEWVILTRNLDMAKIDLKIGQRFLLLHLSTSTVGLSARDLQNQDFSGGQIEVQRDFLNGQS